MVYREFLHPIGDYLFSLKCDEFIYEFIMPLIFGAAICWYFNSSTLANGETLIKDLAGVLMNVLAILIGFSLTCLTVLISSGNSNLEEIKKVLTDRKLDGKRISLYRLLVITFSYIIIVEVFMLVVNSVFYFIISRWKLESALPWFLIINGWILLHVFLLNIRNTTNLYFVILKRA